MKIKLEYNNLTIEIDYNEYTTADALFAAAAVMVGLSHYKKYGDPTITYVTIMDVKDLKPK